MLDIQPTHLFNEWISLVPLESSHFDKLYEVAADPLIWEQHPNKNRYKKDGFEIFFKGAIESKGAFMLIKTSNG